MSEPNTKCYFRYEDGSYCKRWAQRDSRFCFNHQPSESEPGVAGGPQGDPAYRRLRFTAPEDVKTLVGDTLNAVRAGRVSVGQAGAISSLVGLWLKLYEVEAREDRTRIMQSSAYRYRVAGTAAEDGDSEDEKPQRTDAGQDLETAMSLLGGLGLARKPGV